MDNNDFIVEIKSEDIYIDYYEIKIRKTIKKKKK